MKLAEALKIYGPTALISMILIGSLVTEFPVYQCKGNEPEVRECVRLSSSNRTCYTPIKKDLCSDGKWELIQPSIAVNEYKTPSSSKRTERCTPGGCT